MISIRGQFLMNPTQQSQVRRWPRLRDWWIMIVGLLAFLAGFPPLRAEMTLLHREMFATSGSLTAAAPGSNFSSVVGSLYQRPGGPHLASESAASADFRGEGTPTFGRYVLASQSQHKLFVGGWFFIKSVQGNNVDLLNICDIYGNPSPTISITNGVLGGGIRYNSFFPSGLSFVNRWIFLGIATHLKQGVTADVRFYYKLPGQPMQSWAPINDGQIGVATLGQVTAGAVDSGAVVKGRMGAPFVYAFSQADFSDVSYPADLIEPESGLTWYCDPLNGNDAADGTSPATAWKSVTKINEESYFAGLLPANRYEDGDTLIINTADQPLDQAGISLKLSTSGLNVRAAAGQEWIRLKSYRSLEAGGWTPTGTPNVYATSDTQPDIVLWEDDKFMHHPVGATFASVAASLSATPGSFWTDGATLYAHPFGSTDPRSDGKRYERSYRFAEGAAVVLYEAGLNVQDIHSGKTCLANAVTNNPVGTTGMAVSYPPGRMVIRHCYLYMGAKHVLGIVQGGHGDDVLVEDVQAEQGSPYADSGGQTVWVSFNHQPVDFGIVHRFLRCRTVANAGLIGSTQGTMSGLYPVYFIHNLGNLGEPEQFERVEFTDCDFGKGNIQGDYGAKSIVLSGTTCGGISAASAVTAERCFFNAMNWQQPAYSIKERNCVHVLQGEEGELRRNPVSGNIDIQGCTFDARQITGIQGGVPQSALFNRENALNLVFRNNLVLMPATPVQANVFSGIQSTDSVQMSHNAYSLGGNTFMYQYNDGTSTQNRTLSQWQTLGFDAGSFESSSLNLSGLRPGAGSPLINAGLSLGPLQDHTGAWFRLRNDVGAYEAYPTTYSLWQVENFTPAELAQPSLVNASVSYLEDGVSNLVKYALGLYPDQPASASLPQLSLDGSMPPDPVMTVVYQRSRWGGDVTLQLQFSQNLLQWDDAPWGSQQVIDSSEAVESIRAVITPPPGGRGFVRLRVTQP
jgi:hypothetical protein